MAAYLKGQLGDELLYERLQTVNPEEDKIHVKLNTGRVLLLWL